MGLRLYVLLHVPAAVLLSIHRLSAGGKFTPPLFPNSLAPLSLTRLPHVPYAKNIPSNQALVDHSMRCPPSQIPESGQIIIRMISFHRIPRAW